MQPRGRDPCHRPDASPATLPAPLVRLQVAIQRVAHVLARRAHPAPGGVQRPALAVVEPATHRRTIRQDTRSRRLLASRFPSCGPPWRLTGAGRRLPGTSRAGGSAQVPRRADAPPARRVRWRAPPALCGAS